MKHRVLKNRLLILVTEKQRKDGKLIRPAHLADEIGISRPTIYAWLNNDITKYEAGVVTAICDYFECDLCDLLYFETIEDETSQ